MSDFWMAWQTERERRQAAERELAKVHAIPAETLDQVEEALEAAVVKWAGAPDRARAALSALRAARSEKSR